MTGLLLRLRWWIDEKRDERRDAWQGPEWTSRWSRLRWWTARQVDRLPGQCWADLADFGLGRDLVPWAPRTEACERDARETGCCYCGKVCTPEVAALPDGPRASVIVRPSEPA